MKIKVASTERVPNHLKLFVFREAPDRIGDEFMVKISFPEALPLHLKGIEMC